MAARETEENVMDKTMRSVFVGNIPYEATEERLKEIFSEVGPVLSFKLVYDRESGKPKGYGFCEYQDQETALSAMRNLNGYEIGGRSLRVDNACTEKSRMEMQSLLGGPQIENPYGDTVDPERAPEAISKAVASLPPEQMFELLKQMKLCVQNNPVEARTMMLQNPQLAYALLQAQVIMRIVDPDKALSMLHQARPLAQPLVPPPDSIAVNPQPVMRQGPMFSGGGPPGPSMPGPMHNDFHRDGPPMGPGGPRPMFRDRLPGPGFGQDMDLRQMDHRMPPGGPRMPDHDMRMGGGPPRDRDMRGGPPMGGRPDFDMPMSNDPREMMRGGGDRDFRGGPPMMGMGGAAFGDPRGGPPGAGPMLRPPMQQGGGPRPPLPGLASGGAGGASPGGPPSRAAPVSAAAAAAAAGGNLSAVNIGPAGASDQEKAALIMQVLQLSDEQIAMLPNEQRQSILVLKEQIAKSAGRS